MNNLENKIAIVTGGGAGLGRATAFELARQGAKVVIAEWSEESGNGTCEEMKKAGYDAIFIKTDVSKESDVATMVEKAVAHYGRIDILVNNASVKEMPKPNGMNTITDMTVEAWDALMSVNLRGMFLVARTVVPEMIKTGGGALVNVASVAGVRVVNSGTPNGGMAYTTAKHALIGFTKTIAHYDGPHGIRANCVCPGYLNTDLIIPQLKLPGNPIQKKMDDIPAKRIGEPEEVANVIAFLVSDANSYMNGSIVSVDGGMAI